MHSSSHPPCAFRNRIARYLGVLVAAALVATLGLPRVAQAQTIGDAGIMFTDADGLMVTWTLRDRLDNKDLDHWIVTFTKPNGMKVVLDESDEDTLGDSKVMMVSLNQKDLGTWWIQVAACFMPFDAENACPAGSLELGNSVGYTHGPPAAPENFTVSMVPGGGRADLERDYGRPGHHGV